MSADAAPDLGDLARTWWERLWPRSRRGRVALGVSVVVVVLAHAGLGLSLLLTGRGAWPMLQPLLTTVPLALLLPTGTSVTPAGLARRRGVLRLRRTSWRDVVAVEPAGRWREHGVARLADGRLLDLVGLAPDDVERLAAVLDETRDGRTAGTAGRD